MTPPAVRYGAWVQSPIDRFILARLESAGLASSAPATPEHLVRRTSIGLIGLPPTPEEVAAFAHDHSAASYQRLIERQLASPHYGERWARHWLDLARYGESDGFEHDAARPHSWRYRDYVIHAFNEDKPFDRFIREQIAGDELWPDDPAALIATGFHLLGPDMVDSADPTQRRLNTLNDMTDTTASVFLGLTLGCARCHDHKFEPFTQRDYFAMQAFFAPAQFQFERPLPSPPSAAAQEMRSPALMSGAVKSPAPPRARALQNTNGPAPKTYVLARGDYNHPREEVQRAFPAVLEGSSHDAAHLNAQIKQSQRAATATGPRTALANWVAGAANPLTARVMVNRIWQHHFGRGLVASPSDFGTRGRAPTHPELLDWLADEFIRAGWSVKRMHRLILQSATYQQSSTASSDARARDPENLLLSHQNRVRLEGEVIRDSLFSTSGCLNPQMDGPSVALPTPAELTSASKSALTVADHPERHRRSLYLFARRNLRQPFLEVFDAPDSALTCPERGRSTTAPQSLTLLNSREVMAAAQATAQRLMRETRSDEERLNLAFRLALGRSPEASERSLAHEFLKSSRSRTKAPAPSPVENAPSGTEARLLATAGPGPEWIELCRALFNLNGFVYAE